MLNLLQPPGIVFADTSMIKVSKIKLAKSWTLRKAYQYAFARLEEILPQRFVHEGVNSMGLLNYPVVSSKIM